MTKKVYSDEEIIMMINDPTTRESGFRYFMTVYQEKIYWAIRKIVITHENTDDVIQNTFVKAYRNIEKFEMRSSLYSWLYRIAINEAITFKTKASNNGRIIPIDGYDGYVSVSLDTPEAILQKLDRAIDTLPDRQKIVFMMRYFEEISYEEMSNKLKTSVGALKASYHHAVKKIEDLVTK
jgi:RNA polymerase sigma factor (sigma-70 family)